MARHTDACRSDRLAPQMPARLTRMLAVAFALSVLMPWSGAAVSARAADELTETYRLEVLGQPPPGQAFVAVYTRPWDDRRAPGLASPPRGGQMPISTWVVMCGSVSKRDYQKKNYLWVVREVLGNGERECRGNGSVYTRTIRTPPGQERNLGFLHVADHQPEWLVQEGRGGGRSKPGGTHTAYYDFRIGAGRVGGYPGLADRRFKVDVSIELRGRSPRDILVQTTRPGSSGGLCSGPAYRGSWEGLPRCKGSFQEQLHFEAEGLAPGTRIVYALIAGETDPPIFSSCADLRRELACADVTLDSDVSIRIEYDFDKGKGESRVVRHPTQMPHAGAGGMAAGPLAGFAAAVLGAVAAAGCVVLRRR